MDKNRISKILFLKYNSITKVNKSSKNEKIKLSNKKGKKRIL